MKSRSTVAAASADLRGELATAPLGNSVPFSISPPRNQSNQCEKPGLDEAILSDLDAISSHEFTFRILGEDVVLMFALIKLAIMHPHFSGEKAQEMRQMLSNVLSDVDLPPSVRDYLLDM